MLIALVASVLVTSAPAAPSVRDTSVFLSAEFTAGGLTRRYRLFVPERVRGGKPPALIVMLHGCAQDPEDFARGTRFNELAAAANALVLYPEQPVAANAKKCWNWYEPANQQRDAGEPGLLAAMTRDVAKRYHVDDARIYVGGMSAGGAMAVVLVIAYPDLYAAVATHSGVALGSARDLASALSAMQGRGPSADSLAAAARSSMHNRARAIPLFAAHGTADKVVSPAASDLIVGEFAGIDRLVLRMNVPLRVEAAPATGTGYPATVQLYRDRAGAVLIEQWRIDSLGHAFSGGSSDGSWTDPHGPPVAAAMLRFFLAHPMPRENR